MSGSYDVPPAYRAASIMTANDLRTVATTAQLRELSRLSLPEIEELADEVARILPAGNVPAMILSGLARLRGRQVASTDVKKHIQLLFIGARQALDEAVYTAFFGGSAAVLYGYQKLLRLAGKDTGAAFPDGTWQFYLEFALREDSARHANETTGFHEQTARHGIRLRSEDMLASWVLATVCFIRQLPDILANEWREPVTLKALAEAAEASRTKGIDHRAISALWEQRRPYRRGSDAGQDDYPAYRRRVFDRFIEPYLAALPKAARQKVQANLNQLQKSELPAYQRQLSWLAYLEPESYSETRVPYSLEEAFLGIIWQGRYFLLPQKELADPGAVRAAVAAVLAGDPPCPAATLDEALITARRAEHAAIRQQAGAETLRDLDRLRHAPVLINWDERDWGQPLAMIRQGKRGVGDHALTIFRTAGSMVLDHSHIFFDGAWGAAVAEILTNEALSWARYLAELPPAPAARRLPYCPALQASPEVVRQAYKAAIRAGTSAETETVRIKPILALRKLLKQRSDLAQVTVNDLFILYRGLHAMRYRPSPRLQRALDKLASDPRPEAKQAHKLVQDSLARLQAKNPAILIPVDARPQNPRERVFPTTFRNPFTDFWDHHQRTLDALHAYQNDVSKDRSVSFQVFFEAQRYYLRLIGGFGELLGQYKKVALAGQSTSTATIKLLGHLPEALQKLLDSVPTKFDVLNEVIKGEEVFSNIGRVAGGATLRRFISAKDDNDQKTLIWGVLTDDGDVVRLSLRDFRPHVDALHRLGMADLARQIAQEYVDTFAEGLNVYIGELRTITVASRESLPKNKE